MEVYKSSNRSQHDQGSLNYIVIHTGIIEDLIEFIVCARQFTD